MAHPADPFDYEAYASERDRIFGLYRAGRLDEALAAAVPAVEAFPWRAARTLFWIACFRSLLGDADGAISALRDGLERGFWWSEATLRDSDLDAIRGDERFADVATACARRESEARASARPGVLLLDDPTASASAAPPRPLVLALPMRSESADEALPHWSACARLAVVAACESSQLGGTGEPCWDDRDIATRDLAEMPGLVGERAAFDAGRIVLGGASQGGARAVAAALSASLGEHGPEVRGFVAIVPTFGLDITVTRDELRPLWAGGAVRGVRGAFLLGTEDRFLSAAEEIVADAQGAGMPLFVRRLDGLGHDYPDPELIAEALAFVLGDER